MRAGTKIIIFLIIFLVIPAVINVGYNSWLATCGGQLGCTSPIIGGPISSQDPIFNILNGRYDLLFSSLQSLTMRESSWHVGTIPWIGTGTIPLFQIGSFNIPYISTWNNFPLYFFSNIWWGQTNLVILPAFAVGWPIIQINACSFFGFSCSFTIPAWYFPTQNVVLYNFPWLQWTWTNIATITLPTAFAWSTVCNSGCTVYYPAFTQWSIDVPLTGFGIQLVIGLLMIFLGLGITVTTALGGIGINPEGSKIIMQLGLGVLLWTTISLFIGNWLLLADAYLPFLGEFIQGFILFVFAIALYMNLMDTGASL